MNQPDNEKQTQQEAPAEPLKVRTDLRAGARESFSGVPDGFSNHRDPSYTSVGISGNFPIDGFDPYLP